VSCADASREAGVALAGTATRAERWLLVEHPGRWGRDPVDDTPLPADVTEALGRFDGRVLLLRRPGRPGSGTTVFRADTAEEGGRLRRLDLTTIDALPGAEREAGEDVSGPLVLVCAHGRRDPCCARLGPPTYEALLAHLDPACVWQSSHHGGHRFAANVLVLPWGVQLGRVGVEDAAGVASALGAGRIPLEHYRGRTLYEPPVQAAEVAVRRAHGLDAVDAVHLVACDDAGHVCFLGPDGELRAIVEEREGPAVPASCGDEPAPTTSFAVRVESST